uniref:Uncharacterized protein n=1 Tax=Eutreptiella gymnastica TaxID=73025 RepID=A0A7S4FWC4_9EUGL|mmetsp:Transcript_41119/g.69091  ORF Transcript_41119/g.69091 Transcript_41119/m.69091 type:complete len:139 (+) Transcript_41119:263-679(+)
MPGHGAVQYVETQPDGRHAGGLYWGREIPWLHPHVTAWPVTRWDGRARDQRNRCPPHSRRERDCKKKRGMFSKRAFARSPMRQATDLCLLGDSRTAQVRRMTAAVQGSVAPKTASVVGSHGSQEPTNGSRGDRHINSS